MTRTIDQLRRESFARRGGEITTADISAIIDACNHELILIRHSHGRLLVPAQDIAITLQMIDQWPGAYVRDMSWPSPHVRTMLTEARP